MTKLRITPGDRAHGGPRRFFPRQGTSLNRRHILGPWRPSGAVDSCGFFAVTWTTTAGEFWAPLHDFDQATRNDLIEECAQGDLDAGHPGAWLWGRRS